IASPVSPVSAMASRMVSKARPCKSRMLWRISRVWALALGSGRRSSSWMSVSTRSICWRYSRTPAESTMPCATFVSRLLEVEDGDVLRFEQLGVAQIHVNAGGEAGVEAAHGAHDVDALELVGAVLLEDRGVLDRVLVGTWCAVDVTRIGVPGSRRV